MRLKTKTAYVDYGPSVFDVRHNLVMASVYEFPFGPGKRFLQFDGAIGQVLELEWFRRVSYRPSPNRHHWLGSYSSAIRRLQSESAARHRSRRTDCSSEPESKQLGKHRRLHTTADRCKRRRYSFRRRPERDRSGSQRLGSGHSSSEEHEAGGENCARIQGRSVQHLQSQTAWRSEPSRYFVKLQFWTD